MSHDDEKLWSSWLIKPWYMWIWFALLVLTLIEVVIPEPALIGLDADVFSRPTVIVLLILLATVKTVLVAVYYMHLRDEKVGIIPLACAPFIFSVFLTVGLFPYSDDAIPRTTDEPAVAADTATAAPAADTTATKE